MLGDVPIFGSFTCGIDENGRIFLPSMAKSEKGDQIVLCTSDVGKDVIDVYPLSVMNDIINRYDEIMLTSTVDILVERAKNERRKLCSSAISQVNVDAQRRVFINTAVLPIFGESTTKLYGLGEGNRIKFFGSKESYEEYTGHSYVKRV